MIIQSERVWIGTQFIKAQLEIEDKKIKAVYPYDKHKVDKDYGDKRIVPGFIDIHCHGAYGFDTNDATQEGMIKWAAGLPAEGLTSFLATTVTQGEDVLIKALENVAEFVKSDYKGAKVLGVHFEGPYLNMDNKGAQPPQFIALPSVEQFKKYQEAANGLIKVMTLATENDPDFALTHYASQNGVVVSIGHSGATYEDALMGIANGARSMTHVYNGMNGLNHRQPNLVGAAMRVRDVYGEIICDGNHVVWPAINDYVVAKGKNHAIMITDSLAVKGSAPGKYLLGGNEIEVRENGSAYLVGTDTLAGSTLKFNVGLRNLVEHVELPFEWAINMVSTNPADVLGLSHVKGRLVAGYDADIVVLDNDYEVVQTYVLGEAML